MISTPSKRWDERYSAEEYIYGTEPNTFLVSVVDHLPRGRVLCLAEGEARNAVFLAEHGCDVTAVDCSAAGLAKARQLAEERGVRIQTIVADLATDQALLHGVALPVLSVHRFPRRAGRLPAQRAAGQHWRSG